LAENNFSNFEENHPVMATHHPSMETHNHLWKPFVFANVGFHKWLVSVAENINQELFHF
jgi:hypothetical protein